MSREALSSRSWQPARAALLLALTAHTAPTAAAASCEQFAAQPRAQIDCLKQELNHLKQQADVTQKLSLTDAGQVALRYLMENTAIVVASPTAASRQNPEVADLDAVPDCLATKVRVMDAAQTTATAYVLNGHCPKTRFIKLIGPERAADGNLTFPKHPALVAMFNREQDCLTHESYAYTPGAVDQYDLMLCAPQALQGRALLPETKGLQLDERPTQLGERLTSLGINVGAGETYDVRWLRSEVVGTAPAIFPAAHITGFLDHLQHAAGESGSVAVRAWVNANDTVSMDVRGIYKGAVPDRPVALAEEAQDLGRFIREHLKWLLQVPARDPCKALNAKTGEPVDVCQKGQR